LVVVVALVAVYQKNLVRLYTALTLYDQDKIANNFLSMYQSFNATVIPASTQPFRFPKETKTLPDSFEYENHVISTQGFIDDSQTTGLLVLNYWYGHRKPNNTFLFRWLSLLYLP
jgi:hypothetical protein